MKAAKFVVVADDAEGMADMLAELLEASVEEPLDTGVAHNGAEVLRLARLKSPSVVLLDLDMPVMDGVEAAIAIREEFPTAPPPLMIAFTGNAMSALCARARLVFDYVFIKPHDIATLVRLVDRCAVAQYR